jgi:hypothetical protein
MFLMALWTSSLEADTPRWSYLCEEIMGKYTHPITFKQQIQ